MSDRLKHALDYARRRSLKLPPFKRKITSFPISEVPKALPIGDRYVYIVLCADYVKVGIARKPKSRLSGMQTGCPFKMKIMAQFISDNAARDERKLHHLLRKFKHRGEWFKLPDSLIAVIVKAGSINEVLTHTTREFA